MKTPLLKFWSRNLNFIMVLELDFQGKVLDMHYSQGCDSTNWIADIIALFADIRLAFKIPESFRFDSITAVQNPSSRTFPGIPEVFNFKGQDEEYHTLIPIVNITLENNGQERLTGYVRLTPAFSRILNIRPAGPTPIFCVDPNEKIVGFNRHFAALQQPGKDVLSMLGGGLSQWMDPTPGQATEKAVAALEVPEFREIMAVDSIFWNAQDRESLYFDISPDFNWRTDDLRIDIDVESAPYGPPCLILGDKREPGQFHSDRDGYLLGPDARAQGWLLKKNGELLATGRTEPSFLQAGTFTYFRLGNVFLVQKEGKTIFAACDFSSLNRNEIHATLHLRSNTSCRIRRLTVLSHCRGDNGLMSNLFISARSAPHRFFLVSRIGCFPEEACTVYSLTELSDLKKNLDDLETANRRLRAESDTGSALIGTGKAMQGVRELAEGVAPSPATVLIEGETGTGKEVVARLIHALSPRADSPFIKVDCSTLPATLLESLLFGHEKGAFTGADTMRRGLFEQAENGTLFIDETGNLSLEAQAKLLQFLQDRTITRLGGGKSLVVNVRILVATNKPLQDLVNKGLFREDLYHRMAVLLIRLPTLQERREDIPALSRHFLEDFNRIYGKNIRGLSPEAYRQMNEYPWPGNVRELRNVLERAYLFSKSDEIKEISLADKNAKKDGTRKKRADLKFLDEKPSQIEKVIRKNRGNIKAAAGELDVSVRALYYFLKKQGLNPNNLRQNPRKHSKSFVA